MEDHRPKPIVGNMFDIPQSNEWVTYTDMGKKFGKFTCESK